MSKKNRAIIYAHECGYRVTRDGMVKGINVEYRSLYKDIYGYLCFGVALPTDRKRKQTSIRVHRLQAYQKYGDKIFDDGIQARHLNGRRDDNRWANISIGTQSDNMMDRPAEERKQHSIKAGTTRSPLSPHDVLEIVDRIENGNYKTYQVLAEEYGLKSKGTISDIMSGNVWTHVTGF